jgi:hypothetical protein
LDDIPVGEPIVPPYNGSKVLPVAQVLHEEETTGASPGLEEEEEESSDTFWKKLRHLLLVLTVNMARILKMIHS